MYIILRYKPYLHFGIEWYRSGPEYNSRLHIILIYKRHNIDIQTISIFRDRVAPIWRGI